MTGPLPESHPLRRLFAGTVQHIFYVDVGLCDPQIAEYLIDLLSTHIHCDDFFPFQDMHGRRLENLAEVVTEAHLGDNLPRHERERAIHRYIGDFSLFWTGVFPEGLRHLQPVGTGNRMDDYLDQGKKSYAIAYELTRRPDEEPPATVLRRLSERFEHCVYGLHLCRQEWDAMGDQSPLA